MSPFFDAFMPEKLEPPGEVAHRRAEVLIRLAIFLAIVVPLTGLAAFVRSGSPVFILAGIGCGLLTLTVPVVLKKTGSLAMAGTIIILTCLLVIPALSVFMGGILAAPMSGLLLVPLVSLLFQGLGPAKIWLGIVVAIWLAFLGLHLSGYQMEYRLGEVGNPYVMRLTEILIIGLVAFAIMVFQNRLQQWLLTRVRETRDEALQASRAKSDFLAKMSHELRTPLTAVIGYSEMLLDETRQDQAKGQSTELIEDLERIHGAGLHLLAIVNDVLDLSKVEAGKMSRQIEKFDLNELIDEVVGTIRPMTVKYSNHLHLEYADNLGSMCSDPIKIRQILLNLLSNACKFAEDKEVILRIESAQGDRQIIFYIEDRGIGMSDDQLATVFDAFVQADRPTTSNHGGTGLGLTITRHFCGLLEGNLSVESNKGEGTKFTVRLPRDLSEKRSASTALVATGQVEEVP